MANLEKGRLIPTLYLDMFVAIVGQPKLEQIAHVAWDREQKNLELHTLLEQSIPYIRQPL